MPSGVAGEAGALFDAGEARVRGDDDSGVCGDGEAA
jgi:hypothetical protein